MIEPCLYADIAGDHGCALRATIDSPPPTAVQMKELLAENDLLRHILKRAISPLWWARLSYPDNEKYWTPEEQALLHRIHGTP